MIELFYERETILVDMHHDKLLVVDVGGEAVQRCGDVVEMVRGSGEFDFVHWAQLHDEVKTKTKKEKWKNPKQKIIKGPWKVRNPQLV